MATADGLRGEWILALDEGTTNAKALAVSFDGDILARGSAAVPIRFPAPGHVEQDAELIWDAVEAAAVACLSAVPAVYGPPSGLAISNQRESVVAWDRGTVKPLTPVIGWQDSRTADLCEMLRADPRALEVSRSSGLTVDPMFSAPKMRALLDELEGCGLFGWRGVRVGTIDAWLVARLTRGGSDAIEVGNASRTLLLDIGTGRWAPGALDFFSVPVGVLPPVVASTGGFGVTRGLGWLPDGTPVLAVMGDSHAALYGHGGGVVGTVKATYGTGSSVMVATGRERVDFDGLATTIAWGVPEMMYASEGNISASGAAMDWVARMLGVSPGKGLDELASSVSDAGGVDFVPALTGLGAPWWDRRATAVLSGMTAGTSAAHVARAALEAVAHQIADVVDAAMVGQGVVLHADGGATASRLLMQTQADLLGMPVVVSKVAEVGALGVARLAAESLGVAMTKGASGIEVVEPAMSVDERAERRRRWREAVGRSRWLPGVECTRAE